MRRFVVALGVVSVVLSSSGALAGSGGVRTVRSATLTYHAPVPCSVLCPAVDDACGPQDLAMSYGDKRVTAPRGADHLLFKAYPETDWDIFVCSTSGTVLRSSFQGLHEPETIAMRVRPGAKYVLRAFNWADASDLRVTYAFLDAV